MNDQKKSTSEVIGQFAKDLKENLAAKGIDVSQPAPLEGDEVKTLSESIDELTKALNASDYNVVSEAMIAASALRVNNLADMAAPYLTDEAKAALAKTSKQIIEVIDLEKELVTECLYLSVQVRSDKLEEGVKVIAEQVNLLAAGKYIHSALAPVSAVELAKKQGEYPTSAVFAFVHVPAEQASLAKSLCTTAHIEGQVGEPLHSLKIDLPPGEFFAFERVTVMANLSADPVKELVDRYLSILPKGSELVSANRCAIIDLSLPVELRFRCPVMDNVKEVRLDHVRTTGTNSGELKQGNVIVGIKYIGADGKDIYESIR